MLVTCCRGGILSERGRGEHCWGEDLCGRTWARDETNLLIPARESDTWSLGALRGWFMGSHGIAGLTSCHYNFVDFLIALEKNTPKPGVFPFAHTIRF